MKRVVYYIVICFLVVSMVPFDVFALEPNADTSPEQPVMTVDNQTAIEPQQETASQTSPEAALMAEPPAVVAPVSDTAAIENTSEVSSNNVVELEPTPIPANSEMIVSGLQLVSGRLQALELHSMSDKFVNLANWDIDVVYTNGTHDPTACRISLTGYLYPKQYFTFVQAGQIIIPDETVNILHEIDFGCADTAGDITYIEIYPAQRVPEQPPVERIRLKTGMVLLSDGRWVRRNTTSTYRSGVFATDFTMATDKDATRPFYAGDLYFPP